jgi:arginase
MERDAFSLYEQKPAGESIAIISVPLELGSDERGLAETPEYLRRHGLEHMFTSLGCEISERIEIACPKPPMASAAGTMKHVREIATVGKRVRTAVEKASRRGDTVLVIGGDHSAAFGTVAGASAVHQKLGVIYIDAHPDANTHETTISGNVHGMVASAMMGQGHSLLTDIAPRAIPPEHFLFVGLKDFDQAEIEYLRERGVQSFTALDIATHGLARVVAAVEALSRKVDAVWISMDMDSIDEQYAPGVAMSTPDGLTRREILGLAQHIGKHCKVAGMDISEMVPAKDKDGITAKLALELIARFFGYDYNWYRAYMSAYRQTNIANEPEPVRVKRERAQ